MDLQTIKNNYAQEQGYEDWADLYRVSGRYDETIFFKHENSVIILAEKAALEKAYDELDSEDVVDLDWKKIQKVITNPENLIL